MNQTNKPVPTRSYDPNKVYNADLCRFMVAEKLTRNDLSYRWIIKQCKINLKMKPGGAKGYGVPKTWTIKQAEQLVEFARRYKAAPPQKERLAAMAKLIDHHRGELPQAFVEKADTILLRGN